MSICFDLAFMLANNFANLLHPDDLFHLGDFPDLFRILAMGLRDLGHPNDFPGSGDAGDGLLASLA